MDSITLDLLLSCVDPEWGGGRGLDPPLKINKGIEYNSITGPDPLKNHKATKLAFDIGPSSAHYSEKPFQ